MKYYAVVVITLLIGGYAYSYVQFQRLNEMLKTADAEFEKISEQFNADSSRLDGQINVNASTIDTLRTSNDRRIASVVKRLNGLEAEIRKDVVSRLTNEIIKAATVEAIDQVIAGNLPKSESFLIALASVLTKRFREELKGEAGEQVDPVVLASLLARNATFLDAIRFEIVAKVASGSGE